LLAICIYILPTQLQNRKHLYQNLEAQNIDEPIKNKKFNFIFLAIIILALATYFFSINNNYANACVYLLRVFSIYIIWQKIVAPFLKTKLKYWSIKYATKNQNFHQVQLLIPTYSKLVKPLYAQVAQNHKGIHKLKEFVLGLIVIALK
jgi:hypothetical protein